MEQDMFIDESNCDCHTGCFYLQLEELAFGSQRTVTQRNGAELKTDGVQALQKSISAYKKAGFPSQVNVQCFLKVITKYCRPHLFYYIYSIWSKNKNKVKVKVKFVPEQAMKAQKWSIALLYL
jgi:hypothetical protein